ncbi:MAG: hypothetical protein ACKOEQ_00870 [Verrucomicrobiota bacterium]
MDRRTSPSRAAALALALALAAANAPALARQAPAPDAPAAPPATSPPATDPSAGTANVLSAAATHPFTIIPNRNGFRIQPPPPPPPPVEEIPKTPPPPPSNVTLTGFTVWKGKKQVYLQVASAAGKPSDYLTLGEDEAQGDVHVLEIDPKRETVKLNNAGQEVTLNFKDNGAKAVGSPTPAPGAPNSIPSPVASAIAANNARLMQGAPGSGGPTVIGRGGVTANEAAVGQFPGAVPLNGGVAVPMSSPAFNSTLPGFNSGIPNSGGASIPNNSVTVGGQALESTTAVPMVPGQDRIINGRRIPAPPPLPIPTGPIPTPGN